MLQTATNPGASLRTAFTVVSLKGAHPLYETCKVLRPWAFFSYTKADHSELPIVRQLFAGGN